MDTQTPIYQRSYMGALPLILTDSSALMDLGRLEIFQDSKMGDPGSARPNIARAVIDGLVGGDSRTMVLSRRNIIELFPTVSGRLDLQQNADGSLQLPEGAHPELAFGDSHIIYQILQEYQQMGKLRCYGSTEEMLHEEVGEPKGGIVIVDSNARGDYPENGRIHNRRTSPMSKLDADKDITRAAQAADAGDDRLVTLAGKIMDHADEHGYNRKFMIFNNDNGLKQRFDALGEEKIGGSRGLHPAHARPLDMVAALYKGNQEFVPGCTVTGEELARFAEATARERSERGRTPPSARTIEREAGHAKNWLDLTAAHVSADSWVDRTDERAAHQIG